MEQPETKQSQINPASAELNVEKLIYGGQGLARLEGRVVFVPFVLPGEAVRVELGRQKSGLIESRLLEVLAPSSQRTDAPCPFFFRCGGCQYQHTSYQNQIDQKRAILRDVFERIGKRELPENIEVIAGEPWGYRNRTQLHLRGGEIGYFEAGSHRLCPVDRCPISSPTINESIRALQEMVRDRRFPQFIRSIEFFTNEQQIQLNVLESERGVSRNFFDWCEEKMSGAATGSLEYTAAGSTFRVSHNSFFQVNRFLVDAMVDRALRSAAEGGSALDIYAGVGLFSLPLARKYRRVTAVESSASAVRDLEFNAERTGVSVDIRRGSADMVLESMSERPDFVLADPPRAGLGKRVVEQLLRLKPPRITIVSCDPATLARDLTPLVSGGYDLDSITLVDLFPQTFHIETITDLVERA